MARWWPCGWIGRPPAFHVLGAYGYLVGARRGRVRGLHASHQATHCHRSFESPHSCYMAGIADLGGQIAVRHLPPAHDSTAALDTALGSVRDFLDSRSFVLRNKCRTNLALGLVRLHLNGIDLQSRYHTLLRQHLDATGGLLPPQRTGKDTGAGLRTDLARRAVPSLRR